MTPHQHDEEVTLDIPRWLVWAVVGVMVGAVGWLAIDWFNQRRKATTLRAVGDAVFDDLIASGAVIPVPSQTDNGKMSGNVRPKVRSDEGPVL